MVKLKHGKLVKEMPVKPTGKELSELVLSMANHGLLKDTIRYGFNSVEFMLPRANMEWSMNAIRILHLLCKKYDGYGIWPEFSSTPDSHLTKVTLHISEVC